MSTVPDKYKIENTTKEERIAIVRKSLACGASSGSCENCGACDGIFGAADPYLLYLPYINGEKELDEVTKAFNARYFK